MTSIITPLQLRKLFLFMIIAFLSIGFSFGQNPIVDENLLPGTPQSAWDALDNAPIEGFAQEFSVEKGDVVHFKIDVESPTLLPYTVKIYRLGWYQGNGARFIADLGNSFMGKKQDPWNYESSTGKVDCQNWDVSAQWTVPMDAVSGVYIARLDCPDLSASSILLFVVKDDNSNSPLLFKTSDATWQAYNNYGGNSFYNAATPVPGFAHATKVSYQRVLHLRGDKSNFFNSEYPMIRFLEKNGYNVSYTTDMDMSRDNSILTPAIHKAILSVGHDEYWSKEERHKIETARSNGVHIAFFSGNEVYWKTRWEDNFQTLVCYKEGTRGELVCGGKCDPVSNVWTGLWRDGCAPTYAANDGCSPEGPLTGQMSWTQSTGSIKVPSTYKNLRFWKNTSIASLADGQTAELPYGTLGNEWDPEQFDESYPAHRIILSNTIQSSFIHKMSVYRHSSGSLIFSAGTMQWPWGLDDKHDLNTATGPVQPVSRDMQQATVNLLYDMGATAATLQADLVQPTAPLDVLAPSTTITSPIHNSTVSGPTITVTGTSADNGGGAVAGVEVSIDNGATWHAATGLENWTYIFSPTGYGTITILVRAFDDSGNLEVPGSPGSANAISILVSGPFHYSVFNPTYPQIAPIFFSGNPVELGMKFNSAVPGVITGFRYYKGPGVTGLHIGHLWDKDGNLLASENFTNETSSGWQSVELTTPVTIAANTTYIVSYFTTSGEFTREDPFFTQAVVNGFLRGLANGEDGGNGVYAYNNAPIFPDNTSGSSSYYADVLFEPSDITAPQVLSTDPVNSSIGIALNIHPSATFDEAIDPASVSTTSVIMTGPGNAVIPGTTSVSGSVVTYTPNSDLAIGTLYTVTLKGGITEPLIKDISGNALAADYSWSFTTGGLIAPNITTQPSSQVTCANSIISFNSVATGIPTPTVQWQVSSDNGGSWTDIPAAVSATYTFTAQSTDNNNQYRAVWTNTEGVANSDPATLTVAATITGTIAAVNSNICPGSPMQLQLTSATGPSPYTLVINSNTYTGITVGQPFFPVGPRETIFTPSDVPSEQVVPDNNSVEVGVKFTSDKDGIVKGIRFYKGSAANGGTHIGSLWSQSGTLLGSATFTGESASGWQEVTFTTPVAVTANTVYVASYFAPLGNYSRTGSYFVTSHPNGSSLTGLQDTPGEHNAVYLYTGTSAFPVNNFAEPNYWVDVVFAPYTNTTTTFNLTSLTANNGCSVTGNPVSSTTITVSATVNTGTVSGLSPLCIGASAGYTSNGDLGGVWSSTNTAVATVNPATGLVTAVGPGTTDITYTVTGCNGTFSTFQTLTVNPNADPGTITGTSPLCIGATDTYTSNGEAGGVWSSTNTAVATVNAATGLVTAVSAGTTDIKYTLSVGCNSPVSSTKTLTVSPNATAGTVSGPASLCTLSTGQFTSDGDAGGTWTTSNPLVATVDAGGLVTALIAGPVNIIYTVSTGCNPPATTFKSITVDLLANAGTVSGTSPLCIGATATYTTDGNTGGTWSSTNPLVASVDAGGVVTAVGAGTSDITYTISGTCIGTASAFSTVTVNPNVSAGTVSGTSPLCIGATDTYTSNGAAGGTWSSTNTTVATVNPTTGLVTTLTAGTTDITYTVNTGCGAPVSSVKTLTVNSCATIVNLKLFLQGYYLGGGAMQPVMLNQNVLGATATQTDNITVELHDANAPYAVVATTTAMLNTDGTATATFAPVSGSYYIAIKHRNTLQTWSANPVAVGAVASNYDFSTAANQAFGDNMIQIGGVWTLYTGDMNQDEFIDAGDYSGFDNDNLNGVSGVYVATDMNGDGFVDAGDYSIFDNNNLNGVQSIHP